MGFWSLAGEKLSHHGDLDPRRREEGRGGRRSDSGMRREERKEGKRRAVANKGDTQDETAG